MFYHHVKYEFVLNIRVRTPASSSLLNDANASGLLEDYSVDVLLVALPTELMAHNIQFLAKKVK